jgi:hypothetical protein
MFEPVALGATWFVIALAVHVVVWRRVAPRRELPWLFAILLGVPFAAWALAPDRVRAFVVAASLSLAYIQTYPAAQARSPSLMILLAARRLAPHACVTRDNLAAAVRAEMSLDVRFSDLDRERLLEPTAAGPRLTPAGRLLAAAFVTLRRALNLNQGAG